MTIAGAYDADRAAALSGVPKSTIHYWARKEHLVPSVSREKLKLWSYTDLFALRTVYWLRQPKHAGEGREIPRTTMRVVKRALAALRELDLGVFEHGRPSLAVTPDGDVIVRPPGSAPRTVDGQVVFEGALDLIAPFDAFEWTRGPDLQRPSPFVRILPRRLSGAPHIVDTRIESLAVYALAKRGFERQRIGEFYPEITGDQIRDAIELEERLDTDLTHAA